MFFKKTPYKLIVGLGNHGAKYAGTRHNIGWWVVDEVAGQHGFGVWQSKFQGVTVKGQIDGVDVVLLKPHTYMNNSGQSVQAAAKFYKIAPADIFVIHDDLDLKPLEIRTKIGGGHAGHNGLKSLDAHLATKDYNRLRIGIGRPLEKEDVSHYVLQDFSKAEAPEFENLAQKLAETITKYLGE